MLCLHKDVRDTTETLVTLFSSSDHSDIVTLDSKEHVHVEKEEEEEGAASEELYLGTPCSSQYTFTASDTGRSCCFCIKSADCRRKHEARLLKKQQCFLYVFL